MKQGLPQANCFGEAMRNAGRKVDIPTWRLLFYKKDIKSAVEWLKDKLEHYYCDELKASNTRIERKVIETWIDKAFEDVSKVRSTK